MSRRIPYVALAIPLAVLTVLALLEGGLGGFYRHHRSWGGLQVFADLVIMALLACAWMIADGRRRGLRAWPFVALTLAAGSFGPLAYLALHGTEAGAPEPAPRWLRPGAAALAAAFGVLTARALAAHGYVGIWRLQFASWASLQVLADLTILCLLGCAWMIRDARGRSAWPWVLLTLGAGSFGPLGYLVAGRPGES